MKINPMDPNMYDTLIAEQEAIWESAAHRIEQLKSMKALASEYAGSPSPVIAVAPARPMMRPGFVRLPTQVQPKHEYDADGKIIIPALAKRRGRPVKADKQLVITNYLREKGFNAAQVGKYKISFGSVVKRTADAAGRTYSREPLDVPNSYSDSTEPLTRVVWQESDRDLFEYVYNRSYAHVLDN